MTEQQKIYLAVGAAVVVYLMTSRNASASVFGVGGVLGPPTVGGPPPPVSAAELNAYPAGRYGRAAF